jgi:hypothetical protein
VPPTGYTARLNSDGLKAQSVRRADKPGSAGTGNRCAEGGRLIGIGRGEAGRRPRSGQTSNARYEFTVEVPLSFEAAEQRTPELLREEGFGVLT